MLKAGSHAPGISTLDVSGELRSLSDELRGGPVLVAFFKVGCPTCQFTFPHLQRFAEHGLNVIGVSQDDVPATNAFREQFGVEFPLWLDTFKDGYPASNAYGLTHVPSLFLVDIDGVIQHAVEGFSREHLEAIASEFGFIPFPADAAVPAFRPG